MGCGSSVIGSEEEPVVELKPSLKAGKSHGTLSTTLGERVTGLRRSTQKNGRKSNRFSIRRRMTEIDARFSTQGGEEIAWVGDIPLQEEDIGSIREDLLVKRVVQVFLSSPFGGFEEERDVFINVFCPMLKEFCNDRGIALDVVDLRWGITELQASQNKIIDVCLKEVENSHIFVGMLGARYGSSCLIESNKSWIMPSIATCRYRYPWLEEFQDRSITEMEWQYGRLADSGKKLPSIFMLRNEAVDSQLSDDPRYCLKNEESGEARAALLRTVREMAKNNNVALYDEYNDRKEAMRQLYVRLKDTISKLVPKESLSQGSGSDITQFAHRKILNKNYVVSEETERVIASMEEWIADRGAGDICIVSGSKYSGTSSLLSTLMEKYERRNDWCVCGFIDADAGGTCLLETIGGVADKIYSNLGDSSNVRHVGAWTKALKQLRDGTGCDKTTEEFQRAVDKAISYVARNLSKALRYFCRADGENGNVDTLATAGTKLDVTADQLLPGEDKSNEEQSEPRQILIILDAIEEWGYDVCMTPTQMMLERKQVDDCIPLILAMLCFRPLPPGVKIVLGASQTTLKNYFQLSSRPEEIISSVDLKVPMVFKIQTLFTMLNKFYTKSDNEIQRILEKYIPKLSFLLTSPGKLNGDDIEKLVTHRAGVVGKTIDKDIVKAFRQSMPQCTCPHFSSLVVAELISHGTFETMHDLSRRLLECRNVLELYKEHMRNLEKYFGHLPGFLASVVDAFVTRAPNEIKRNALKKFEPTNAIFAVLEKIVWNDVHKRMSASLAQRQQSPANDEENSAVIKSAWQFFIRSCVFVRFNERRECVLSVDGWTTLFEIKKTLAPNAEKIFD